jgi:hypothetical protein
LNSIRSPQRDRQIDHLGFLALDDRAQLLNSLQQLGCFRCKADLRR